MSKTPNRVVIERVQWLDVMPILRLGSAFGHALQPGKVLVALLAVLAIHLSGSVLDMLWGDVVETRPESMGVYQTLVHLQAVEVQALMQSALNLDLGLGANHGVIDSLIAIMWDTPRWAVTEYPWFMLLFGADVLFVLAIASGIICRMSATQICQGKLTGLPNATKFVAKRWAWYLLTPLLPAGFAVILGLVLMLAGLVFFNLPVLDVVGALLYGVLLVIGFVIALAGFVLLFALFLMPPAMSVEGTDAFDAISRAFNYVLYKPWQFAAYLAGSIFYLAVVYVLVSLLAGLTAYATHELVGVGGVAYVPESASLVTEQGVVLDKPNMTRYEAIIDQGDLRGAGSMVTTSSWLVARWLDLLTALVIALMFSTLCTLQTQVYLLLRRAADQTPIDECAADDEADPWSSPADMVDPAAQAIAASGPKGHPKPEGDASAASEAPASESKQDDSSENDSSASEPDEKNEG